MEDRSNKTIICSVLFLDIVEYSKKPVSGQISLKERFNAYLSEAIHDVPVTDRIIFDTGDGAAVNFLGDAEDALKAALRLRTSLLNEDPSVEPKLLVRIGINLGPVRLVRDINGQPNIVGDGINVAQRVMGFAEASQIFVSRSYYDAVSRISTQYAGMFHYQGSRTDKHVREHEIYAIGYPGDQTTQVMAVDESADKQQHHLLDGIEPALANLGNTTQSLSERIKQASAKQLALYASAVVVPLLLLMGALLLRHAPQDKTQPMQPVETLQSASAVPAIAAADDKASSGKTVPDKASQHAQDRQKAEQPGRVATVKPAEGQIRVHDLTFRKPTMPAISRTETPASSVEPAVMESYLSVACKDGTQVFVDGTQKGAVSSGSLTVTTKPGKHKIIVSHASFGVYGEDVDLAPGKTEKIRPKVCN